MPQVATGKVQEGITILKHISTKVNFPSLFTIFTTVQFSIFVCYKLLLKVIFFNNIEF